MFVTAHTFIKWKVFTHLQLQYKLGKHIERKTIKTKFSYAFWIFENFALLHHYKPWQLNAILLLKDVEGVISTYVWKSK